MSVFVCCTLLLLFLNLYFSEERELTADIERYFLASGFHSILVYDVILRKVNNATVILIEEMFPKDLSIDPFEIFDEVNQSKVKIEVPFKFINAEAPNYFAQSFYIELCSTSHNNFHRISLPIHTRYQEPHYCKKFGENAPVKMNVPTLKFIFHDNETDKCSLPKNSWSMVEALQVSSQDFTVPVGCKEDFYATITLTSFTLGLSTIVLVIFFNNFST